MDIQTAFPTKKALNSERNQTLHIPSSAGQGSITTIHCNSGIQVIVSDYTMHESTVVKTQNTKSCCGFGFCLSGAIEAQIPCFKNDFIIQSGQSGFFNFPDLESYSTNVGPERLLRVIIFIQPERIAQLTGLEVEQLPSILINHRRTPYRTTDTITPAMRAVLHQMFNSTYQGAAKQLYIEGKILELIAHKLNQLDAPKKVTKYQRSLNSDEIERVRHAAELLSRDLENPPTIAELSGCSGMCRSKLYTCFNEVFGLSPFEYLQHKRMETAERLLRDGAINVTQAAYTVGYSSLSHFTKAFRKHFGVTPSKYSK